MRRGVIFFVLIAILASLAFAGCATKKKAEETVKIIDLAGRTVYVPKKVDKVVAIGPGALRLLVYMNETSKIVGIEDCEKLWKGGRPYILAHPELLKLPSVGSGGPKGIESAADPEKIIKIHPDVIFTTFGTWGDVQAVNKFQEKVGIPVVIVSMGQFKTFKDKDFYKSLEIIGKILGNEERAKEIMEFINKSVSDLEERTKDVENRPTVYVGGVGYRGVHGIFSTESDYPPFKVVNAKNVAKGAGKEGHLFIDKETLLKWDPDVIFIDEGGLNLVIQDYKKEPEFYKSLKAFKNGKVYGLLPYNYYWTNVGTALADAYYIGKVLYPDKFKDINPEKKADEIYKFLVGKPVYNEMKKEFGGFVKLKFSE